ncbi:hypothetical protein [Alistipes putredinis]|uniref:hypothetical protein n=1 Tax=Alistipes putredinis TaxID=28117 RepID=UPI003AB48B53
MRTKEEKLRQRGITENERIDFSTLEAQREALLKRIVDGNVFTLDDINKCRSLIMQEYPEYERPITARSGILFAAEAIRKSFGHKYYLPLYKYPIRIDFGTQNGRICVVHPSNFIEYADKYGQEE